MPEAQAVYGVYLGAVGGRDMSDIVKEHDELVHFKKCAAYAIGTLHRLQVERGQRTQVYQLQELIRHVEESIWLWL